MAAYFYYFLSGMNWRIYRYHFQYSYILAIWIISDMN